MAGKQIKGLTIQIGADTLGLDKALSGIESASKKAASELREVERAIDKVPNSADLWKQKQELLNTALEKSKEKVKLLEQSQKSMQDRLRDGDIDQKAYDKFQEKLNKSREKLEKLKDEQDNMREKLSRGEIDQGAYDKFREKLEKAEAEVRKLEAAEHSMEENLHLGNITQEQYRAFQRELETARANSSSLEHQLSDTRTQLERLGNSSDDAADNVDELGDEAQRTADGGISAMTVALGNLVADGIKLAAGKLKDFTEDIVQTGSEFEAAMSKVGAISGATAEDMDALTAKAQEMGASTKFTAVESAEAFNYMAMAGWKTEDMLSGIDGVLSLAAASGEELGTTSDIVTDAMTAFGLDAEKAGHFADVLAAASSNANTNVAMMGETFKYVAPIAGSMNYSIEDTAEMIGLMANSGIKATNAGTALRSIITRLSTDAGATGKKLGALGTLTQKLGVEFYNADGSARDFGDVIAETREKWQILNDEQQTSYGKIIAGTNAISGWLALMNAAPSDVEKLSLAIRDCDGAATDMSSTMIDNLQGDMTIMESAVDGMKIALSDSLAPALRDTLQYVTTQIPNAQKVLEPVFKNGGELISFAVNELPKITKRAKDMLPVVKGVGAAFVAWQAAEKVMKLGEAIKTGTALMQALNITMAANPAVAVTAGIVGLTVAILALIKAQKDDKTIAEEVADQFERENKAVDDTRKAMDDLKDSYNSCADETEAAFKRTEELWQELDKLTDASGRVKDADKVRADYILNELNNALGTEYTMTGNQINRYKDLAAEIDNVIAKKKAEAMLDDYYAFASGMAEQAAESKAEFEAADRTRRTAKTDMDTAKSDYDSALAEWEKVAGVYGKTGGEYAGADNYLDAKIIHDPEKKAVAQRVVEAKNRYETARETYKNESNNYVETRKNYKEAVEYTSKLREAQTALSEERYDDVPDILYGIIDTARGIENIAENELPEAFANGMEKAVSDMKLTLHAGGQSSVDDFTDALSQAGTIGLKAGKKAKDIFTKEIREGIQKMLNDGYDLAGLIKWAKATGFKVGDVFEEDFTAVVQKQLDAGYDITELIGWGIDSGEDIADAFKDNYTDIVQKQLDIGYEVDKLLQWGCNTGVITADEYARLFRSNVSNHLGEGFDTSAFNSWLARYAEDSGNLYGSTFRDVWTRYLYEVNDLIPHNINSEVDAELYRSGKYHAFGGYINDGGIIAENGPELVKFENGAVRIIPLNRMATNTIIRPQESNISTTLKEMRNESAISFTRNISDISVVNGISQASVPFMAEGGFLSRGRAVVGEVGPELLEIMNGGARITPIPQTNVGDKPRQEKVQKLFYNDYKITANVSNRYDITKLAEELAREQRRIEEGKGL